MTEIEKTEREIKVLQAKLELLKEIEKHKTPVEEAYKRWYPSSTPGVSYFDDNMWSAFQKGYKSAQQDYKVGEYQPTPQEPEKEQQMKELIRESVKWCEEHPDESVEDYLKPHTPEKTEKSLREAFQKVQQTEEWKETQRKIDSNYDDMVKNPPEFLKFELGKTLEQLIERWWCDVFVGPNEKWTMEECIADLCDRIHLWLPKEQSAAGSQSLGVEDMVEGFNDAIKKIKSKIHNKKDT